MLLLAGFGLAGAASESLAADPVSGDPRRAVLFASMEAGPASTFGSVGFKLALGSPLDASGFRVMGKAGLGVENSGPAGPGGARRGDEAAPEVLGLAGYEWKLGTTYLALQAGFAADARVETRGFTLSRRTKTGPRLQADLWSNPTPVTLIQASAYLGAERHHWTRLALGWRVLDLAFLGPEAEFYREKEYRKLRLGLHLTGLSLWRTELRLSGGWQKSGNGRMGSPDQKGAYATLGLLWKR